MSHSWNGKVSGLSVVLLMRVWVGGVLRVMVIIALLMLVKRLRRIGIIYGISLLTIMMPLIV